MAGIKSGKLLNSRCILVLLALMIQFSISNLVYVSNDCQRELNNRPFLGNKRSLTQ